MNEELRIIINAVTSEAKKNLAGVKEELNNIKNESKESGKSVDDALKTIGKGAAIAVASIVALTTAMVNLTKRSMEFQKSYGQLTSSFQSSGSTVKQASQTYMELFRFLGEADTATEAANLLVQLTNDSENLAQWTKILQGVYAKLPDSIPTESLAEAANETAKTGIVTGALADALNWLGVSEDAMNAKLATTNSYSEREAILRGTLNNLYGGAAELYERNNQALLQYNESQARLDMALAEATRYVVPMMTQLNNLAATLLQVLKPAFETVSAVVIVFAQWIMAAIQLIGSFFGFFGDEGVKATDAVNKNINDIQTNVGGLTSGVNGLGSSLGGAAAAAKELKKQTMGFDELNVVSSQTSTSTGSGGGGSIGGGGISGGGGSGIKIPAFDTSSLEVPGLDDFQEKVDNIKGRMEGIAVLVAAIATGLGLWKIINFAKDMWDTYQTVGSLRGVFKQLMDDLDPVSKEFGVMSDSAKECKDDLDKAQGKLDKFKTASGWLLIIAGALGAIASYSDAWVNGLDWGNFLGLIAGLAVLIGGAALALNPVAALIATIVGVITLLVIGIKDLITNGYSVVGVITTTIGVAMAFAATGNGVMAIISLVAGGLVILWNECDTLRETVLKVIEKIKTGLSNAWQWIKTNILEPVKKIYTLWIKPVIDKIVEIIKKTIEIIGALFVGLWNLLKLKAIDPIAKGFKDLWTKIKEVFKPVTDFFGEIFGKAYKKIKEKFEPIKKFFSNLWTSIKTTFSNFGTILGNAIGGAVKKAINTVITLIENRINSAVRLINGAITLINKLPGVSVEKITELKLPRLAKGGIVTSSTIANIGEAGREAVLPLENNTGWMDILAERIASRSSTPSRLVLMLDGKELGYATINSINKITRQTGALQLSLA